MFDNAILKQFITSLVATLLVVGKSEINDFAVL